MLLTKKEKDYIINNLKEQLESVKLGGGNLDLKNFSKWIDKYNFNLNRNEFKIMLSIITKLKG